MAYFRGLVHGAALGTVIGLCIAPQTGDRTRTQLRAAGLAARSGAIATSRALRKAAPAATGALHVVARGRHRGEGAPNGTEAASRGIPV